MTTTISDLPRDLAEEIVSRIPLKHMRAVRLTCREWDSLATSESLTKMRIGKETVQKEGESRMMVLTNDNLYFMSIVVDGKNSCTEIKGKLTNVKISLVFHCEGLLLCLLKDDKTRLVLWNPFLGQTMSIKLRYRPHTKHIFMDEDMYRYALGYKKKKTKKSHKILRFVAGKVGYTRHYFTWYEIYDFDSGIWTTLDVTPYWRTDGYDDGVSLKGNNYWCATKRNSPMGLIDRIICFDFTRERFGPLLRLPVSTTHGIVNLSCVREEKLAALYYEESGMETLEIWITTKIKSKKILWSKFLKMDLGPQAPIVVDNFSFFIDEVKKVTMLFEGIIVRGDDGKFLECNNFVDIIGVAGDVRQVDLGSVETYDINVCSYVPSFVQIKQPARGKKRKQSILEKCRFDQKLLIMKRYEEACKRRKLLGLIRRMS